MNHIEKRKAAAKWILLALLLYCLVITILCRVLPDNRTVAMLCPFTIIVVYLEQWSDTAAIVVISHALLWLLVALPLIGWLLLCKPVRAGKALIIAPYCLLLAFNLVITASHIITGLGMRSLEYVRISALLAAVSLVISVAVLISVSIWRPKRS